MSLDFFFFDLPDDLEAVGMVGTGEVSLYGLPSFIVVVLLGGRCSVEFSVIAEVLVPPLFLSGVCGVRRCGDRCGIEQGAGATEAVPPLFLRGGGSGVGFGTAGAPLFLSGDGGGGVGLGAGAAKAAPPLFPLFLNNDGEQSSSLSESYTAGSKSGKNSKDEGNA
eukprot:CAMPEP_0113317800 /NCGR_PEP_ID=MMETSP0010_2-20120614/12576_1 /TAXON_ID=216773 ORGANISM="Corethron hystrix, Strain 308" /NCGR_SAMPLE_ID=MMETSP0010_2 /ASSEMBLY_ACC=CAM_ASM_000155 /LENGTH=164 /DNA_ID=CAMNT_0000174879 /DNA_START=285 /DNA_END=775 /DNA_ORIENTATION=- /assembly_acc=CAM_ASM_000155